MEPASSSVMKRQLQHDQLKDELEVSKLKIFA